MINENNTATDSNSTTEINSTDVTAALNGILTTDKFSASPQMSAFLKYVVEQTLMGNTRRIKAFTIPKFILRSEMPDTLNSVTDTTGRYSAETILETSNNAHVSVQQPSAERENETTEAERARKASMNQLWQAYRSTSKVA